MPSFISLDRVKSAVIRLCDWRGTVKQQSTAHIFPLLALLEKGVNSSLPVAFEESDDFAFFDRYCRVPGDTEKPYFDPFSREFRIASHPHSNIATARKNTFQNRWKAASLSTVGEASTWTLAENFAEILEGKLFVKAESVRRINVVDLGCWLFRNEEFSDEALAEQIQERFLERFPFKQSDYDLLFEFQSEPRGNIFQGAALDQSLLTAAIHALAFDDASKISGSIAVTHSELKAIESALPEDDPILVEVKSLLTLGTSGIILKGAPGTGKTWYADEIALSLTGAVRENIFRVQFHPSFTYEDFFDGYIPSEETKSGFKIVGKIFREAIQRASCTPGFVVFVIDEINRGNTAKIFGEALTYIESGWRGVKFRPRLSTEEISVPKNLIILATMNPHDRSITPLDMALLRRFDHVEIPPSPDAAGDFLVRAGMPVEQSNLVCEWFKTVQTMLPFGIGHTFFLNVSDVGMLGLVWRYRMLPFCQSILEYEPQRLEALRQSYEALERRLREAVV